MSDSRFSRLQNVQCSLQPEGPEVEDSDDFEQHEVPGRKDHQDRQDRDSEDVLDGLAASWSSFLSWTESKSVEIPKWLTRELWSKHMDSYLQKEAHAADSSREISKAQSCLSCIRLFGRKWNYFSHAAAWAAWVSRKGCKPCNATATAARWWARNHSLTESAQFSQEWWRWLVWLKKMERGLNGVKGSSQFRVPCFLSHTSVHLIRKQTSVKHWLWLTAWWRKRSVTSFLSSRRGDVVAHNQRPPTGFRILRI